MSNLTALAALLAIAASTAGAQVPCTAGVRGLGNFDATRALQTMQARGGELEDVIADAAECGHQPDKVLRIRMPSRFGELTVLTPLLQVDYVGGVPDQRSTHGVWEGLGINTFLRAGLGMNYGRLHALLAPEFSYSQNRAFTFLPNTDGVRNAFNSNWYAAPYSIDLPSRYGARPISQVTLGQSAVWATLDGADVGLSTSSQGWGPGIRGHLLLGPGAPGIPRIFGRTNRPILSPIGIWSGTAFFGMLTESPFFDDNSRNNVRTLAAVTVAWSPDSTSGTVIGFAHGSMLTGALFGWGGRQIGPLDDQMNSLFVRVDAPEDGLRAWAELARSGTLPSLRHFLTIPYQGISYLFGVQRAIQLPRGTILLSGEMANLEQPTGIRGEWRQDFYTSSLIPQGWTQRGQIMGDGIGPGGQSQWVAVDWAAPAFSAGIFGERVRWNEDAFLRQYLPYLNRHDVALRWGLRGSGEIAGQRVHIEFSAGKRLNYLFQNGAFIPGLNSVDVTLTRLRVWITPSLGRLP